MSVGSFELQKDLMQGVYVVRAYTTYMMNYGIDNFYQKNINIYNPQKVKKTTTDLNEYLVYFLPEGGNFISGIKNTVAFKASDKYGLPSNISGKIIDETGIEQLLFNSVHDGMGRFEFIPKSGVKYFAECKIGETYSKKIQLPVPINEGAILSISLQNDKTYINVNSEKVVNVNLRPSYIMGVQENMVAFKMTIPNDLNIYIATIPTENLPSGILKITAFNKEHKPLSERLLFVNSDDYKIQLSCKENLKNLNPRKKNEISFTLLDTLSGNYSISVTNADNNGDLTQSPDNIISRFLLTDDLKGYIHEAGYYFELSDEEHKKHLDLVMLTSGWRKYNWNDVASITNFKMAFADPNFITLKGTAYDSKSNNILANTSLNVIVKTKDKKTDFLFVDTDSGGNFEMPGMIFEDTASFFIQNNSIKNAKILLKIKSPSINNYFNSITKSFYNTGFIYLSSGEQSRINKIYNLSLNDNINGVLLDEVKVKTIAKSKLEQVEKKYTTAVLGNNARETLDFITDPPKNGSRNIFDFLRSRLNGVDISGGPLDYNINYRAARSLLSGDIPMNIYLNEQPVSSSQIATMLISDVAMVKVFSTGVLSGAGGALVIYTKRISDYSKNSNFTSLKEIGLVGFSPSKEFFSPDYANNENFILTDQRSTLYWNPYLTTTATKQTMKIDFYNSDNAKRFKIIIEGVTAKGRFVHFLKIIE